MSYSIKTDNTNFYYTGGGIFEYSGACEQNKAWFMTSDNWMSEGNPYVLIVNENPAKTDMPFTDSWCNEHQVAELNGDDAGRFISEMFKDLILQVQSGKLAMLPSILYEKKERYSFGGPVMYQPSGNLPEDTVFAPDSAGSALFWVKTMALQLISDGLLNSKKSQDFSEQKAIYKILEIGEEEFLNAEGAVWGIQFHPIDIANIDF